MYPQDYKQTFFRWTGVIFAIFIFLFLILYPIYRINHKHRVHPTESACENHTLDMAVIIAAFSSIASIVLSSLLILEHLSFFLNPQCQAKIVRILFMVPLYSLCSFLSFVYPSSSDYLSIVRDTYESYVLYNFFSLVILLLGGLDFLVRIIMVRSPKPIKHLFPLTLFVKKNTQSDPFTTRDMNFTFTTNTVQSKLSCQYILHTVKLIPSALLSGFQKVFCCISLNEFIPISPYLLFNCRRSVFQFMVIKPLISLAVIVLTVYGEMGSFLDFKGSFYTIIIYNASITVALYGLTYLYLAMIHIRRSIYSEEDAVSSNYDSNAILPKFVCIKVILFFSYWQGLVIAILNYYGAFSLHKVEGSNNTLHNTNSTLTCNHILDPQQIQELLICSEMLIISLAHKFYFSSREFIHTNDYQKRLGSSGRDQYDAVPLSRPNNSIHLNRAIEESTIVPQLVQANGDTVQLSHIQVHAFEENNVTQSDLHKQEHSIWTNLLYTLSNKDLYSEILDIFNGI